MFLDNSLALILGKRSAVHITDLVGLAVSPAGRDAGQQGGGDVAHGRIVVPFGDHQPLVLGGQLRVELARLFGFVLRLLPAAQGGSLGVGPRQRRVSEGGQAFLLLA